MFCKWHWITQTISYKLEPESTHHSRSDILGKAHPLTPWVLAVLGAERQWPRGANGGHGGRTVG